MITFLHLLINQPEKAHSPPIGVLALVAALRQAEIGVEFTQFTHLRGTSLDPAQLHRIMAESQPIIAVSTMINSLPLLVLALRLLRKTNPEKTVVVGGPGMVGIGTSVLKHTPEIDVVAFGEGESTVVPLFKALAARSSLRDVPGIHYRQQGAILTTRSTMRTAELDQLPLPDYSGIDFTKYHSVGLMASRGCPFSCTFCDVAPAWGRRNTHRSVEHVLDEMQRLSEERGVREFGFADDLFVVNRKWVEEFCARKVSRGITASWRCCGHINLVSPTLLASMASAGCKSIFYGVESGSNTVLRRIKKNFSIEKAFEVIGWSLKHMEVTTNFMWGFPEETPEDLDQTLFAAKFVEELGAAASLLMLAPLNQAPMSADAAIRFDASAANIFCADYRELAQRYRADWHALVESNPTVYGAFYRFESANFDVNSDSVDLYLKLRDVFPAPVQAAPWQRVWA